MYSVWFGCETCRRSFLKLNDLFQHKEVHPLEKRGIQSIKQTISFPPSENQTDLNLIKRSSQTSQQNPFVLFRRLSRQEIQNSSVLKNVSCAKYTKKAGSTTLPTGKRSGNNVTDIFQFQCKLCLVKFDSDSKLTLHLNTCVLSHQHRDRFCVPCNTKFHQKHNLKRHISTRHVEQKAKSKQCEHCPMKFVHESELVRHTLIHTNRNKLTQKGSTIKFGQQKFQCHQPHCGKTFHLRHHLANHLATHSDARPFKCPKPNCLKTFKTKDSLRKHMREVHRDSQQLRYPSKNCGSSSTKENIPLRQHLLTHLNSGRFQCPEKSCSRTFNSRGGLRYHKKTHSDLRPFKCPVAGCEKSFKLKVICRIHLMSHSDARPFSCPHQNCDKAYKFRDKLKRHLNSCCHSHSPSSLKSTKIQPKKSSTFKIKTRPEATHKHVVNLNTGSFNCKQYNCRKRFSTISSLNRHRRSTHSKDSPPLLRTKLKRPIRSTFEIETETNPSLQATQHAVNLDSRPFICQIGKCGQRFALIGNLKRHLLTVHTDEKPFKCPVSTCEFKCADKSSLKRHNIRIHSSIIT